MPVSYFVNFSKSSVVNQAPVCYPGNAPRRVKVVHIGNAAITKPMIEATIENGLKELWMGCGRYRMGAIFSLSLRLALVSMLAYSASLRSAQNLIHKVPHYKFTLTRFTLG